MNEDRLSRELGDLARQEDEAERARFDERWDRLAAGTLTAEEEAELKTLAGSSPEAQEAYEAFRPLGADFQARMVSAAAAELVNVQPSPPPEPPPRVLPFRRAAARIEVWLGTAAAVAAGLFFFCLRTPASLPPLPGYELASLVLPSEYRGPGSGTAAPGSPVRLTVTPADRRDGQGGGARLPLVCGSGSPPVAIAGGLGRQRKERRHPSGHAGKRPSPRVLRDLGRRRPPG